MSSSFVRDITPYKLYSTDCLAHQYSYSMAVIVTQEMLPDLYNKLQTKYFPECQKICGEIRCTLDGKWREFHNYEFVVDQWPDFNTVIWKPDKTDKRLQFLKYHYGIVSRDVKNLRTLLNTPGLINWGSLCRFAAISDTLHGVIDEVSEENGGKLTILPSGNVWSTDLDKLKIIPVQGGFSLQQLTPDQAELVVTDWENAGKGALPYVKALINNYLSLGLLNENQQFVGWMLETNYGTIGLLQVLKEFRGQGYSKVLVSNLAKMVLETGRQVHVYIHPTNDISVNLHKGLGFVCHAGSSSWLRHDPK